MPSPPVSPSASGQRFKPFKPFAHQRRVRDLFGRTSAPPPFWRGLILYHSLGSGKTCTAIMATASSAAAALAADGGGGEPRRVVVMTPASLRDNYEREMARCMPPDAPPSAKEPTFVAYNGLQHRRMQSMRSTDFDRCVVVIDEFHNFCARASTPGTVARRLYDLLMGASDVRFLLLSGTPIVNRPFEIAFAINLVRGPLRRYDLAFFPAVDEGFAQDQMVTTVALVSGVVRAEVLRPGQLSVVLGDGGGRGVSVVLLAVREAMRRAGARSQPPQIVDAEALPTEEAEFDRLYFSDAVDGAMSQRSRALLARRVAGVVSHVDVAEGARLPRYQGMELVRLPMGDLQVRRYVVVRNQEIRKERARARAEYRVRPGAEGATAEVYRAYSRAACDFAFPPDVERPYMATMRQEEMGHASESEAEVPKPRASKQTTPLTRAYADALRGAMDALRRRASVTLALKTGALGRLSCKFAELVPRLGRCPGPALVYSQFRTVEGLGALAAALRANGWTEFGKGPKKSGPVFAVHDGDEATLDAFNAPANARGGVIRALLITQSGAEGISLKAVREVHLMEPYWNEGRVHQVVGRAVRPDSHAALPAADRTVRAFLYLATLPEEVVKREPALRRHDGGLSTDEAVHALAHAKARAVDSVLEVLRAAST